MSTWADASSLQERCKTRQRAHSKYIVGKTNCSKIKSLYSPPGSRNWRHTTVQWRYCDASWLFFTQAAFTCSPFAPRISFFSEGAAKSRTQQLVKTRNATPCLVLYLQTTAKLARKIISWAAGFSRRPRVQERENRQLDGSSAQVL